MLSFKCDLFSVFNECAWVGDKDECSKLARRKDKDDYSTNIRTEYFKHAAHSPFFFSLQNAVYFIMLPFLVPVLFTFYLQGVLKFKKKNSGAKGLIGGGWRLPLLKVFTSDSESLKPFWSKLRGTALFPVIFWSIYCVSVCVCWHKSEERKKLDAPSLLDETKKKP